MKKSSRKEAAMKRCQTSKDNQATPIDNIKTNYKSKGLHELCLFETINPEVCRKTVGSKTNPAQRFKKKIGQ
uniref:Uncharacterized protein n=1 Tax=Ciona savignyi TaxID=51511 RepID=H2ZMM1_CIOSA